MKRPLIFTLIVVGLIASGVVSFQLGARAGHAQAKDSFGPVLASVQADLGLSNLQRLRALESDLVRGCSQEVLAKLRFDINAQLYVLASIYREHKDSWVTDELTKRDSKVASELEGFKQSLTSWTEPKCGA